MIKVESGKLVKILSCLLSFLDKEERLIFFYSSKYLYFFNEGRTIWARLLADSDEEDSKYYQTDSSSFESIAKLSRSVADEFISITLGLPKCYFNSNIQFEISVEEHEESTFAPPVFEHLDYTEPNLLKNLSLALNKSSKDNYKGCFGFYESGDLVLPGTHQITFVKRDDITSSENFYNLTHTQLNKVIKIGEDLSLSEQGVLCINEEGLSLYIQLPKMPNSFAEKTAVTLRQLRKVEDNFTLSPRFKITEPKKFKDFFKGAKSTDRQYDLCEIKTDVEQSRISISFFVDKQKSNLFVFNDVEVTQSFSVFLQSKQVMSIAEMGKEEIELIFSSSFEPLKVKIDNSIITYLMPAFVG
jgi:hypothetical protein